MIWANFGDFGDFDYYRLQNFEKILWRLFAHIGTNFGKFWLDHKVTINHRGGILIFCQILSKLKILDFRVKDLKLWILGLRISNFEISPILSISVKVSSNLKFVTKITNIQKFCVQIGNFCVRVKDFKFWNFRVKDFKFHQNHKFSQTKFLISHIFSRALGCPTRWSLPGAAQFSFTPLSPAMASARTRKSKIAKARKPKTNNLLTPGWF